MEEARGCRKLVGSSNRPGFFLVRGSFFCRRAHSERLFDVSCLGGKGGEEGAHAGPSPTLYFYGSLDTCVFTYIYICMYVQCFCHGGWF